MEEPSGPVLKPCRNSGELRGIELESYVAEISGPKPGAFETPRAPSCPDARGDGYCVLRDGEDSPSLTTRQI